MVLITNPGPLFRSKVVCTAYTSTFSCQRLDFSGICLLFRSLITKRRQAPRKGLQTTPQSLFPMLLARNSKHSLISSTIGSYHCAVSVLGSNCDTSERVLRRRRRASTNGSLFSPFRPAFNSIGSVGARSARLKVTPVPNSTLSRERFLPSNIP